MIRWTSRTGFVEWSMPNERPTSWAYEQVLSRYWWSSLHLDLPFGRARSELRLKLRGSGFGFILGAPNA